MTDTTKLPPLPDSEYGLAFFDEGGMHEASGDGYTDKQMRDYGAECRRMALEEAISTCLLHVDEPASKEWNLAIKCCLATIRTLKDKA